MEILKPLTVGNIRFASGHILDVTRVDQEYFEPSRLQDLKERDPVDSGRLHGHGFDVARFQPVSSSVKVIREGRETAYRLWGSIRRHGDVDLGCPHIYTSSIRLKAVQHGLTCLAFSFFQHGSPLT